VPTPGGNVKRATITWEGNDPNIEPTVALYYSTSATGFSGNLIVDGLRQTSGTHSGSYVWDVTPLQPGAYYVYAVIYDTQGVAQAYAPGAVVVPAQPQNGSIVLSKTSVSTTEAGGTGQFKLRLGSAPTAPVSIGLSSTNQREGTLSPTQLTFTPDNWSTLRTVTVTGQDDCAVDGTAAYQIVFSSANSLDPQFAGLKADTVSATNSDDTDRAGGADQYRPAGEHRQGNGRRHTAQADDACGPGDQRRRRGHRRDGEIGRHDDAAHIVPAD
jgi:hypothetical protein